jgi:tetratricopeptide (TPR) repeat protein
MKIRFADNRLRHCEERLCHSEHQRCEESKCLDSSALRPQNDSSKLFLFLLFSLAMTLVFTSTAFALELPDEVRGYYKDRVSSAPGYSDGVAPTVEKAKTIEGVDIGRRETAEYDFSDESVLALAVKGWEALNKKDEQALLAYTSRCIELYQEEARDQQAKLSDFAPPDLRGSYEALNNVAACYFMLGEFYKYQKDWDKARENYKKVVDKFYFSQYWDPRGWWWQPGKISEGEIEKIDTGYYEKD